MTENEIPVLKQGEIARLNLSGEVVKELYATGSKSERKAIMLRTPEKDIVLRLKGGKAFHDPELEKLVGKKIEGSGILTEHTFIISDWKEIED